MGNILKASVKGFDFRSIWIWLSYMTLTIPVILDSGSNKNIIPKTMADKMDIKYTWSPMSVQTISKENIMVSKSIQMPVKINDIEYKINFVIADIESDFGILGLDFLEMVESLNVRKRKIYLRGNVIPFSFNRDKNPLKNVQNFTHGLNAIENNDKNDTGLSVSDVKNKEEIELDQGIAEAIEHIKDPIINKKMCNLLQKHKSIFSRSPFDVGHFKGFKVHLDLNDTTPIYQPIRPQKR